MTDSSGETDVQMIGSGRAPRTPRVRFDSTQELKVATTVGVALLSAATLTAAVFSRTHGDLDGKNFSIGLIA